MPHRKNPSPARTGENPGVASNALASARDDSELHRLLVESVQDCAIYALDMAGNIVSWNAGAERITGLTATESLGRPFSILFTEGDVRAGEPARELEIAMRDDAYEGEGWRLRKDDTRFWAHVVVRPLRDDRGETIGFASVTRDLTIPRTLTERARQLEAESAAHRAAIESEVRESVSILHAIVENSPIAIVVLDNDLRITRWNPSAEQMFGWSADEMLGQPYAVVIPEETVKEYLWLRDELRRGKVLAGYETQRRRSDGSLLDVVLSAAVLRDPNGPGRGFVVLMTDVTERRKLEMQFRHAVKLGAVGQLAGGVAHDFNNLLTVITSYSGLLLAQLEQGDPMRGDVEQIGGAAKRAATVTRQLLAFSRQQMVRPQLLTLNEIVTGLESLLRRLVRENIEIVTSLDPDLGLVEADPGQMEQVIANLVVNARDAMPEGGTLMIQTANAVFDGAYISRHRGVTMTPGQYALLVVSDTGTGMTPEVQARVFEPFYTTKAPGEGTGLGLATVYGIVKQSGGFVWLYGEPGRGTTFKVYLPFAKEATEPLARGKDHARDPGGSETILVVEDDAALRAAACRAIQAFGYHVLAASNGREALEICEQHDGRIHLIVTDVVMPEMSGGDLARQVAEHRPGIKVLLMSGYTRDATVRQGIVRDGRPFLDKPFTPDGLVERIREVLDSDMKGASG